MWDGVPEQLDRLRAHYSSDRGNASGLESSSMYWACCNDGVHFDLRFNVGGWYSKRAAELEILIDAPPPEGHRHLELRRIALNTENLWDVLNWDPVQTAAFAQSMDAASQLGDLPGWYYCVDLPPHTGVCSAYTRACKKY